MPSCWDHPHFEVHSFARCSSSCLAFRDGPLSGPVSASRLSSGSVACCASSCCGSVVSWGPSFPLDQEAIFPFGPGGHLSLWTRRPSFPLDQEAIFLFGPGGHLPLWTLGAIFLFGSGGHLSLWTRRPSFPLDQGTIFPFGPEGHLSLWSNKTHCLTRTACLTACWLGVCSTSQQ